MPFTRDRFILLAGGLSAPPPTPARARPGEASNAVRSLLTVLTAHEGDPQAVEAGCSKTTRSLRAGPPPWPSSDSRRRV